MADKQPMHLHCRKCVTEAIETGEKRPAVFNALLLDGDLFLICPRHTDEPVGIFELKNPPSEKCDGCGAEGHNHDH